MKTEEIIKRLGIEPKAYLIPSVLDVKGATRTSLPKELHDEFDKKTTEKREVSTRPCF